MTYNIYLERRLSSKTHQPYVCLVADLGYRKAILAFGKDCAELLGKTPEVLCTVPNVGDSELVAQLVTDIDL